MKIKRSPLLCVFHQQQLGYYVAGCAGCSAGHPAQTDKNGALNRGIIYKVHGLQIRFYQWSDMRFAHEGQRKQRKSLMAHYCCVSRLLLQ